jgi:hypothetical protein
MKKGARPVKKCESNGNKTGKKRKKKGCPMSGEAICIGCTYPERD